MLRGPMHLCMETSAFRAPLTGIGYYAWFLSSELLRQEQDLQMVGFDGLTFHALDAGYLASVRDAGGGSMTPSARHGSYRALTRLPFARRVYRAIKRQQFRKQITRIGLFHAVNYLAPLADFRRTLPLIHDISHERHPQTHPPERIAWLRAGLSNLGQFPLVQTVSEFSRREIVDFYGIPPERVRVVYPGVNPVFHHVRMADDQSHLEALNLKPGAFFLAVGTLEPRKNLRTVISAFARLPAPVRRSHPLVIAGGKGWGEAGLETIDRLRAEGSLRLTGYASEPALAALYRGARTVLFASIYEGFGFPTIEALVSGKRPILSDIPVMREVAGDAADYVAPLAVDGWVEAMRGAIDDPRHCDGSFAHAALARAGRYTWATSARATRILYSDALAALNS